MLQPVINKNIHKAFGWMVDSPSIYFSIDCVFFIEYNKVDICIEIFALCEMLFAILIRF